MPTEQLKAWLFRYADLQREIEGLQQQYDLLDERVTAPHSPKIDGMPRGGNFAGDTAGVAVGRLDELAQEIHELQTEATATRHEIEAAIKMIRAPRPRWPDLRAVLRFRYLLCLPWPDVTDALFGAKVDYLGKEDSYQRRVFNLHREALQALAEIVPAKTGQENTPHERGQENERPF